jgi:hypothetical protein
VAAVAVAAAFSLYIWARCSETNQAVGAHVDVIPAVILHVADFTTDLLSKWFRVGLFFFFLLFIPFFFFFFLTFCLRSIGWYKLYVLTFVDLTVKANEEQQQRYFALFVALTCVIAVSFFMNLISSLVIMFLEMHSSPNFRLWIRSRLPLVSIVTLIGGFHIEGLYIISSKLWAFEIFSAPYSTNIAFRYIHRISLASFFVEDLPQLVIMTLFVIVRSTAGIQGKGRGIEVLSVLALTMSSVSLLKTLIQRTFVFFVNRKVNSLVDASNKTGASLVELARKESAYDMKHDDREAQMSEIPDSRLVAARAVRRARTLKLRPLASEDSIGTFIDAAFSGGSLLPPSGGAVSSVPSLPTEASGASSSIYDRSSPPRNSPPKY